MDKIKIPLNALSKNDNVKVFFVFFLFEKTISHNADIEICPKSVLDGLLILSGATEKDMIYVFWDQAHMITNH